MINQDALKTVLHDNDAFEEVLQNDPETLIKTLSSMQMKVATQIAKYGDERPDWYKRATSMSSVIRIRLEEAERFEQKQQNEWRGLAVELLTLFHEMGYGPEELPEEFTLEESREWFNLLQE